MLLGLIIMVTPKNHVSNQHVDVDNNNHIVIDDPVAHEVVDKSNISLQWSTMC